MSEEEAINDGVIGDSPKHDAVPDDNETAATPQISPDEGSTSGALQHLGNGRNGSSSSSVTCGDDENPADYCVGGYHPLHLGDILNHRYVVLKKLGWGHFSIVWLCFDMTASVYCAVKVCKSAENFAETALDEVSLLKRVAKYESHALRSRLVSLTDNFFASGPNGTHHCLVFEILGQNLLCLIQRSNYQGIPSYNVRQIARQVLEGLAYLHTQCRIIHTDLKPENVMLEANELNVRSKAAEAANSYLEAHAKLSPTRKLHGCASPRGEAMESDQEKKLTKTAKKRLRGQIKRIVSFFESHRRWLRQRAVEDLLQLAGRSLLSPSTAGLGVTGQLPFMPFTFDGLTILTEYDIFHLERFKHLEQMTNPPAYAMKCFLLECESFDKNEPIDTKSLKKRAGSRLKGGGIMLPRDELAAMKRSLAGGSEMLKLLHSSPEDFMRAVQEKVQECDRAAAAAQPKVCPKMNRKCKMADARKKVTGESPTVNLPDRNIVLRRDPALFPCKLNAKLADMGNACWFEKHYTDDIQTREYRAVEVILGAGYNESADIWSAACLFWELATGDYLFELGKKTGTISCDDMHIASIIETCGPIPQYLIHRGEFARQILKPNGELLHIKELNKRNLVSVLIETYNWSESEAFEFVAFLKPMLDPDPRRRLSATSALNNNWLVLT
ncbi:serine/threonine-protein kinase SRPK-like [Drosophila madeirensis]|uniref:non-specific serine/threonine protein kinase n=1 Tax=Drosophila madeirensis TaxID=30013 RepID=A0AAU9G4Y4_DROMD